MLNLPHLISALLDAIYPSTCIGCQKLGEWMCDTCNASIQHHQAIQDSSLEEIEDVYACFAYADPIIRALTARYKYQRALTLEPLQKQLLQDHQQKASLPTWIYEAIPLVPIPSPVERIIVRDMHHTLRLAHTIQSAFGLSGGIYELLGRLAHDRQNAELEHEERESNVAQTFTLQHTAAELPPRVILVDDVMTTGSTLKEAARFLKSQGVREVYAITFAHG